MSSKLFYDDAFRSNVICCRFLFNREILGVEFLTDDMDGGGGNSKVTKGSSADKMRTKHMRQDRQFRHATLHDDGNFSD